MEPVQLHHATPGLAPQEPLGCVLSVDGSQASVRFNVIGRDRAPDVAQATVGKFLAIRCGASFLVGVITKIATPAPSRGQELGDYAVGQLDLLGEIKWEAEGSPYFQRGITEYPLIGDIAELLGHEELQLIYDIAGSRTIDIGTLQQDSTIAA